MFAYLDYRAFLRDYYLARKASAKLSYRGFSRRAKLRSPNYLKLVIDGERNLTESMAARFAEACGLGGKAAEYFLALVRLGQAGTPHERGVLRVRMQLLRRLQLRVRLLRKHRRGRRLRSRP